MTMRLAIAALLAAAALATAAANAQPTRPDNLQRSNFPPTGGGGAPAAPAAPAPPSPIRPAEPIIAPIAPAEDLRGDYRVRGVNMDGATYEGAGTISGDDKDCRITWTPAGGEAVNGFCVVHGDGFSLAYKDGDGFCWVLFRRMPDRSLDGRWRCVQDSGTAPLSEVWTPVR